LLFTVLPALPQPSLTSSTPPPLINFLWKLFGVKKKKKKTTKVGQQVTAGAAKLVSHRVQSLGPTRADSPKMFFGFTNAVAPKVNKQNNLFITKPELCSYYEGNNG
jgi:hypothetical protein